MKKYFNKTGICVPTILLPNEDVSKEKWAVIACDQFTSEPEYWQEVNSTVGGNPSTYHIIFPEVYLEKGDKQERIKTINKQMQQYIDKNVLENSVEGFIFVNRTFPNGTKRKGLMISIDLDQYDFNEGSKAMVRATEKTVVDRIPPRVEIRENAPLELPHVLVLIDDPNETVIEPLCDQTIHLRCVYDFDLMLNGGHIEGYAIEDPETIERLMKTLSNLTTEDGLLYAVGDGNHSLATAKQCWNNIKQNLTEKEIETHPARFALVELNNLHDPELLFEPIHRIVGNVDVNDLLSFLKGDGKSIEIINNGIKSTIQLKNISGELTLGVLQQLLDEYRENHPEMQMDYIHGEKSLEKLSKSASSIGFLLKSIQKNNLFNVISSDGCLPRKTFSMGEANEKRYYLEARKIK
jgi:uncharacterized protein (DUF1015 family)